MMRIFIVEFLRLLAFGCAEISKGSLWLAYALKRGAAGIEGKIGRSQ